ncbi:MAG TPA: prepilin-type N-terminal cleavage/methylation domain-containing protein [Planctomycetaceae bacterium]|jgi:prepilin-type N-terminal cleavage/methylation domain-containing protein|nr:prepilin-type N-terminal cleavage/methylation domain-containing protein [Planctomycetaceae bacterium]
MTKRNGFTLFELLVVISLLAVILPMAGGTVFFLLRAQSQSADALRDGMAITQFSHVFRSDVHAARSARALAPSAINRGIVLDLDGSRVVEYRAEPDNFVSRVVRRGETVERRERFRVGPVHPEFAIAREGDREIAVTISPRLRGSGPVDPSSETKSGIRIAAIIGRNAQGRAGSSVDRAHSSPAPTRQQAPTKTASPPKVQKSP